MTFLGHTLGMPTKRSPDVAYRGTIRNVKAIPST